MWNKPLEYWAVLFGMILYAASRDAEKEALSKRLVKVAASAFLTIGLSPGLSEYFGWPETSVAVTVMAVGLIILDTATAIISDKKFIQDFLRARFGGGSGQ